MVPEVQVWTDGSGTPTGPMGWAYVLRYVDQQGEVHWRENFGGAVEGTNNRAELSACIHALRALKQRCRVVLHTDSEYVAKAFTQDWISTWRRKDWRKVKNVDLWFELIKEVERHDVVWRWVPGHSGVEQNERCDKLAGGARRALISALAAEVIVELPFRPDDAHRLPAGVQESLIP